jgi:hypothetical protein
MVETRRPTAHRAFSGIFKINASTLLKKRQQSLVKKRRKCRISRRRSQTEEKRIGLNGKKVRNCNQPQARRINEQTSGALLDRCTELRVYSADCSNKKTNYPDFFY